MYEKNNVNKRIDSQWCLIGNIRDGDPTKHFSAGTKVYCMCPEWGDGYENIRVIGIHKVTRRIVVMIMRSKHITNWRSKVIYKPAILKRLNTLNDRFLPEDKVTYGWQGREEVERVATFLLEREFSR